MNHQETEPHPQETHCSCVHKDELPLDSWQAQVFWGGTLYLLCLVALMATYWALKDLGVIKKKP